MTSHNPYNPLDKLNLAESIAEAVLAKPLSPLPPEKSFEGAGIYVLYYSGDFPAYRPIAQANASEKFGYPIYVGKAIPKGGRSGGGVLSPHPTGHDLYSRLVNHSKSIKQTTNLKLEDFRCRYLVVDDIWISLGERLLIEKYHPLWNSVIPGFGNNDPGGGRYAQKRSAWDGLHPGRAWAVKVKADSRTIDQLTASIEAHLKLTNKSHDPKREKT